MRKIFATTAAIAAVPFAAAQAQDATRGGSYVQVQLGAAFVTDESATVETTDFDGTPLSVTEDLDYDTGFAYGALLGYHLAPAFALEAEAVGRTTDFAGNVSEDDLTVGTFLVNAVLTAPDTMRVVPYAGAGLGFANSNLEGADLSFAYQAKAGLRVPLRGGSSSVGVEAAYLRTSGFDVDLEDGLGSTLDVDYDAATVMATYRFDLR